MILLRSLLITLLCIASASAQIGYGNHALINGSAYKVFGSDLPNTFASTTGYTHNKGVWPGTVWDFSGCPLATTQSGDIVARATGALITPRHLLAAHHYLETSGTVYFVQPNGTVVTRTIVDNSGLIGSDIVIATLNADVTGCAVYKIPTPETVDRLVGASMWCLDLPRTVVTRKVWRIGQFPGDLEHIADSTGGTIIPGDSGQPSFVTAANQLVLLGTHYGSQRFPLASLHLEEIQDYCDETSQTVQTISLDPSTFEQRLQPIDLP